MALLRVLSLRCEPLSMGWAFLLPWIGIAPSAGAHGGAGSAGGGGAGTAHEARMGGRGGKDALLSIHVCTMHCTHPAPWRR